jgi:uncharacterized membrane protein YbhN (UPF0104 family)
MRPTRLPVLAVLAAIAAAIAYLVTRANFDSLPTPTVYALLWLALLAIAELYLAMATRARLAGRPGTRPINPLVVARFVALAKATSIVGALAVGAYAGYLSWVAQIDSATAHTDTRTAAFGVGFALVMTSAALFLERACRVPKRDDDDDWPPPAE